MATTFQKFLRSFKSFAFSQRYRVQKGKIGKIKFSPRYMCLFEFCKGQNWQQESSIYMFVWISTGLQIQSWWDYLNQGCIALLAASNLWEHSCIKHNPIETQLYQTQPKRKTHYHTLHRIETHTIKHNPIEKHTITHCNE